jgi:CDGSH-type Zn-finger protein
MDEEQLLNDDKVHLVIRENGPIRIYGKYKLVESTGKFDYPDKRISICRCGESATMPYCDGTHKRIGFKA